MIVRRQGSPPKIRALRLRKPHGFTLTEFLVIIGTLVVIGGLLLPMLNTTRGTSQSIRCVSNLKTLAQGMLAYAGDHNGVCPVFFEPPENNGPSKPWMYQLSAGNAYLPYYRDDTNFKYWHCPSWAPLSATAPRGSAPWLNGYGIVLFTESDPALRLSTLNAKVPMFADSVVSEGGAMVQGYYIMTHPGSAKLLHLRHSGRVNIAFGDGHVAPMDPEGLKEIGITKYSTYPKP